MELNRIHNIPCQEMFAGLQEQAALIVADPPYGVRYNSNWKDGIPKKMRGDLVPNRISHRTRERFQDNAIDTSWLASAFDALQEGGIMYLFTRWDVLHHWNEASQRAGFKVNQCIVWDKTHWGAGNLATYGTQTENILVCAKGRHTLRWEKREGNVWRIPRVNIITFDGGGRHPTQKPIALFKKIITYSSDVNDLILDPFTGSGAACIAAQRLHRRFIGCDISPTFAAAAQQWIEDDKRTNAQTRMKPMFEGMPS